MRALLLLLLADVARAEPCANSIEDPIATPLHDVDVQRAACLRGELSVGVNAHALIDTPNFHGVIGGDLTIGARKSFGDDHGTQWFELGLSYRVFDFQFAQTAVNKATETSTGPLVVSAAHAIPFADSAKLAVLVAAEVPYSRVTELETRRLVGELGLALTGELARSWRLHARMAYLIESAASDGGEAHHMAVRAGADLAWHPFRRWAFSAGTDAEAGWRNGFSTLLVRAGIQWRMRGGAYRLQLAGAAPLFGDEPTTAIAYLGLARDL